MKIEVIKTKKISKSFRLKENTIKLIENLAKENSCSNTDVVEFLINNYKDTKEV